MKDKDETYESRMDLTHFILGLKKNKEIILEGRGSIENCEKLFSFINDYRALVSLSNLKNQFF